MPKSAIHTDDLAPPAGVFSQATEVTITPDAGRIVFVSGLTARDPATGATVGVGDVRAQTRAILDALTRVLARAGGTLDDVTRVTVYVTDIERDFAAIHEIRGQYFQPPLPASTMVQVSRLVSPDMLIEIEAIAVVETVGA